MIYEVYHNDKTHRDREREIKYIYIQQYIFVFFIWIISYFDSRANKSLICVPVFILILIGNIGTALIYHSQHPVGAQ